MSVAAAPSSLSAPYRGLSPFGESDLDALLFFGRERETEIATANLIASRLTVLYGPSGVGKTSLLRAGVARRVRELGGLRAVGRGPDLACVVFSSWAGDPARALAEAIEAEVAPLVSPIAPRPPAGVSLAEVVEHWTVVLDGDLCLVLDQLEEYFVYHDAQALVEELAAVVLRPDLRANVLLSLRDDALADLDVFKARIPTVFANSLRLDRLDRQAATAAIIGPAQRWNVLAPPADRVDIEPELVDDVLAQSAVAGDAARVEAPYLQLVMERVWNEEHDRGSRMLRASTLAALGGAGAIVRDHLDRALNALDDDAQNAAALMFEHLVTPSGTKIAHRASDLAQFARIPAATAAPVLGALGRERILRPLDDTDAGGERYEIFHDVLAQAILEWRRRREVEHERVVARRRQRRLGALLAAAVVLLLLMTGVTAYAFDQRREARTQAERALVAQDVAQKNARTAAREAVEAEKQRKRAQDARKATAKALKRQQQLTHGIALALEKKTAAENEAVAQKKVANEEKDSAEQHAHAEQVQRRNAEKQAGFAALAAQRAKKKQIEADRARSAAQRAEDRANRLLKRARRGENNALLASKKAREAKNDAVAAAREAEATAGAFHALSLVYRYPETTVELALQAEQEGARKALVTQALRRGLLGLRGTRIIDAGGPTHAPVPAAVYDTSGTRILTGSTVDARLFDAATGNLLRTLRPTPASSVTTVAFSPDSRLAATGLADGRVIVWDLPSGSPHVPLRHDRAITSLSFSPDGTRLATGSADGAFGIWDVGTGISLKDVKLGGRVRSVAFSSDGTKILVVAALANVQKPARLYDATGDSFIGFSQTDLITTATLSSDGKLLATGGRDKFVVLWDAETGEQIKRFSGHSAEIYSVTFSPNGDRLASTSYDDTVRIWDTRALEFKGLLVGHVATVVSAAYSRDGSRIVTAGTDRTARVWQAEGGDQSVLLGHTEAVNTAVFSPDGSRVLTASDDGTARLWTSLSEPALVQLGRHDENRGGAFGASFSDNGQRLATAGADGSVRVWDPTRPAAVARFNAGVALTDAAISADGRYVAASGADGTARVWAVTARPPVTVRVGTRALRSIAFSHDATRVVVTGGGTALATVWNWRTGSIVSIPDPSAETGRCIAPGGTAFRGACDAVFSRDGKLLATGGVDGIVRLWRASDWSRVREFVGHGAEVTGVAFDSTGRYLATSSRDKDARKWDVATGRTLRTFRGHSSIVSGVGFSSDGNWLVTAGPIKAGVWDATTGTDLAADRLYFVTSTAQLSSAAFAPNSQTIATTSFDGTVRTYDCVLCGGLDRLVPEARARLAALNRGRD